MSLRYDRSDPNNPVSKLRQFANFDFFTGPRPHIKLDDFSNIYTLEKKVVDAQYKAIAVESLINKVAAGEVDVNQLKMNLVDNKPNVDPLTKDFLEKLEDIVNIAVEKPLKDDDAITPTLNATDDQIKILLFNRKKRYNFLQRDALLLVEVVVSKKKLKREHKDLLSREQVKLGVDNDY